MTLNPENWNQLSSEERYVIEKKGTEYPFTGFYDKFYEAGTYVCKRCESPLYTSESKFNSGCGWPAFDSNIEMNIERVLDADGRRVEIICRNCKGHLGHVFEGEGFTETNTRHCVNSISIKFIPY
ncbi:MAG: methionine-R-sulfoxide reductase [Bacteroidetes bacterium]|nr:methionine-R-sulfoxide reductase [Bacteroidota bacterium]